MRPFFRILCLSLTLLLLGAVKTSFAETQLLDLDSGSQPVYVEWILDPEEQNLSLIDIRFDGQEPPAESGWKSIKSSPPYINKINETLWFRAPVHWNEQPYDLRLLTVDWYYLDFIEVYACSDSCRRLLESKETGAVRFGNTIPLIYELSPHDGQSFELYIRVSSLAKLALPMSVWQESELQSFEHRHVLLMGVYVGILLVMALYNLVLSYMLRDRNYLIYVLYVFSAILFALSMNGIGRAYLWGENDWLNGRMIPLVSSLMFGLVLGFFFSLLKVSRWKSWQTYLSRGLLWIWGILIVGHLTPLSTPLHYLEDFAITATVILIFALGLTAWRKGNPTGLYLTIGWTVMTISTLVAMLGFSGVTYLEPWMIWFQDFGLATETVLFSFTLAERFNRERKQRDEAQQLSLRYHKEAAEARQLALEVEREAKLQLEDQVERRTRELRSALSRLESLNVQLDARSKMDGLTGLANRSHFDEVFETVYKDALHTGSPVSIIMGDLDHFKMLNDSLGHAAGDACLMMVASIWQDLLSEHAAVVARYGGEEFIAVLPDIDGKSCAELAELLRNVIEERPCYIDGKPIQVTISLGVWGGRNLPENRLEVLKSVDQALYCAKEKGRNKVCLYEAGKSGCALI